MEANVIVKDRGTNSGTHRFSLEDQARALALVLRDEFGVTFSFFDASTSLPIRWPEEDETSPLAPAELSSTTVAEVAADGRARALPALVNEWYKLTFCWGRSTGL